MLAPATTTPAHAMPIIPSDLEATIRRAHPGGAYGSLDLDGLDKHLSPERLRSLAERMQTHVLLQVEIVPPEPEYDRSFTCYIRRRTEPSWIEFNRIMDPDERRLAVQERISPLVYWIIQLSRLGPYWRGYWNRFEEADGRVVAEGCARPENDEWEGIVEHVSDALTASGFQEIEEALLQERVPWLEAEGVSTLRSARSGTPPTVYECVFSEIY